jgi:hypothetical protein
MLFSSTFAIRWPPYRVILLGLFAGKDEISVAYKGGDCQGGIIGFFFTQRHKEHEGRWVSQSMAITEESSVVENLKVCYGQERCQILGVAIMRPGQLVRQCLTNWKFTPSAVFL